VENKRNVMVTGAGGFIGGALFEKLNYLDPIGVDFGVNTKSGDKRFEVTDLRNSSQVEALFDQYQPRVVYHLAAMTNPQRNDDSPQEARECNVQVTQNIVDHLDGSCHLIFLSTDKVLDGNSDPCPNELVVPSPRGLHSSLKYECEKIVQQKIIRYHMFRLSVVHSVGNHAVVSDKAGPGSFIDQAIRDIKVGKKVEIFDNVYRCFLRVNELVDLLESVLNDDHYGLYHVGSKMINYYERLKMLCEENGIPWKGKLIPITGKVVPLEQDVDTTKLKQTFNCTLT
jgi:dTDP-4-dehydrorhamnose reductase